MKLKWLLIFCPAFTIHPGLTQTFDDFIADLQQLPSGQRQAVVDSFVTVNPQSPITETDTLAHFYYTGNAQSVSVPGDATGWDPGIDLMSHIDGTNFWFLTRIYENDARLDYKFVLNGNNWILDPRNPNTVSGGYGPNSELSMPGYVQPPEIEYFSGLLHGTVFDTSFYSESLGNSRTVKVYIPPEYSTSQDSLPVILFHDGLDFLTLGSADNVLDYLIGYDIIDPVIAVFVPAVNRNEEYHGNLKEEYSDIIINHVMVWVDSKYRTITNPQLRAVAGASDGGNISLWIAMNYPEAFGRVAAFSSNVIDEISDGLQNGPLAALEFYLDIGTYDIPVLIPMVHDLKDILDERGYPNLYYEWHEGHSWGNWRAHIDNALQFFFPNTNSEASPQVNFTGINIQVYPNPGSGKTTLILTGKPGSSSGLYLLDGNGLIIENIWQGRLIKGMQLFTIRTDHLKSGFYFFRLICEGRTVIKKWIVQ
jgi:enterochelin esterase family protein